MTSTSRAAPWRRPIGPMLMTLCLAAWSAGASAAPLTTPAADITGQRGSGAKADPAYQRALDALVRGDLAAAEAGFRQALKDDAAHVPAMLGLAELAFRKRRVDDAAGWIDRALKAEPDNAYALASQGRLLVLQGKAADAEAVLQRAIQRDPAAIRPRMDLADMLVLRRDHRRAIQLYREVIALDAQQAGAHFAMGVALRAVGETEAAARSLQAAADLQPQATLAWLELARTEQQRRRWPAALAAADRAIGTGSAPVDAWLVKADVQEAQGQADAALRTLEEASRSAPRPAVVALHIGLLEHRRGGLDAAERAYRRALELDPRQPVALNNLAGMAVERKKGLPDAERWAREAVRLQPNAAPFQHTLGEVLRAQGKLAEALPPFEAAAKLAPRDGTKVFHHARALAEAGQREPARAVLVELLARGGGFAEAADARRLLDSL